ncbi:MAG: glycosyltransferase [Deltaproteobacteria bacterium]|nr:glycosyltransferase [Deltaproteobacteria bacterium]
MSERIRMLLTISSLTGGGAEREFSTLIKHLSRERFESHLCFHRPEFAYEFPDDLPIHVIHRTRPWHTPRAIWQLRRVIRDVKPDVIFSQLHYVNMLTGSALARLEERPAWICRQVNDPVREMQGPFAIWARRSLARADCVLGCSDGVSQAMVDHLRLDPGRVRTMVNAVDVERIERLAGEQLPITRPPGAFIAVHAGRFSPQKNQMLLLEAFSRFRNRPAELWMLGEGDLADDLKERARQLGIRSRVRWLGFQPNPYAFFRSADAFVLSSDHEGLPNVLIEAMICGTPAVSTRCPYGPEELIEDGVNGRLTPVGSALALADALEMLANNPDAAREMGAVARDRAVARFDTRVVCAAYEELFGEMASVAK